MVVAVVDHGGERRRFSRSGGTDHEDQPAFLHDEIAQDLGQLYFLEGGDADRDAVQTHGHAPALSKYVDAEPPAPVREGDREIGLPVSLEARRLLRVHDPVGRGLRHLRGERRLSHRGQLPFDVQLEPEPPP
jgi:hypothetical protein